MPEPVRWIGVDAAAEILGVPIITFRRNLERSARRRPDGGVEAHFNGVRARKFGRRWRVILDQGWLEPTRRTA